MKANKQSNQDKSSISEQKSSENSSSGNKNLTESNTKANNNTKNFIKLIFTLQPNTLEGSKLLTITMIDFSEILNEDQIKSATQTLFSNFQEILINTVPLINNNRCKY